MPFVFLGTGLLLVITGVKGNASDLYQLLQQDFSGSNSFLYWLFAILILGAIGYIRPLQTLSRAFMALVIIVLFLHNKGFISEFQTQFFGGSSASTSTTASNTVIPQLASLPAA